MRRETEVHLKKIIQGIFYTVFGLITLSIYVSGWLCVFLFTAPGAEILGIIFIMAHCIAVIVGILVLYDWAFN
jgi:hypothetical protein